ncbi:hypothetical protein ACFL2F_00580 [Myxococcota bacterium]
MGLRKRPAKRIVTVALLLVTVAELGGLQLLLFGVRTFFGINALAFLLPLSFVFMVITGFHLYQTWPRLRFWFKKNPDKSQQRDKIQRMVVLILFVVVLSYDIGLGWYYALSYGVFEMPVESLRTWSWIATGLLAIHVAQRWRLTFSYFKARRQRNEG